MTPDPQSRAASHWKCQAVPIYRAGVATVMTRRVNQVTDKERHTCVMAGGVGLIPRPSGGCCELQPWSAREPGEREAGQAVVLVLVSVPVCHLRPCHLAQGFIAKYC